MESLRLGVIVGFPILWHLIFTGYAYTTAAQYGLSPRKWAAVTFCVPIFGLFAYLFTRDEVTTAVDEELFVEGPFEIHRSRADEGHDEVPDDES